MNLQPIEAFLRLPGVAGVALLQGQGEQLISERSQLSCYGKDLQQQAQPRTVLVASVQQALSAWSELPDFAEFKLLDYFVYAYPLTRDRLLLVFTHEDLVAVKFLAAKQLQATLKTAFAPEETAARSPASPVFPAEGLDRVQAPLQPQTLPELPQPQVTVRDLLKTLNYLNQQAHQYLGTTLTVNYWRASRPDLDWYQQFQISRSPEITFSGVLTEILNVEQFQAGQQWIGDFVRACTQILHDFPQLLAPEPLGQFYGAIADLKISPS